MYNVCDKGDVDATKACVIMVYLQLQAIYTDDVIIIV